MFLQQLATHNSNLMRTKYNQINYKLPNEGKAVIHMQVQCKTYKRKTSLGVVLVLLKIPASLHCKVVSRTGCGGVEVVDKHICPGSIR